MKRNTWKSSLVEYFFIVFPFTIVFYVSLSEITPEQNFSHDLGIAAAIISGQLIAKYFKCTVISKAEIKVDNSILHLILLILTLTFSVTNYCLAKISGEPIFSVINYATFSLASIMHFIYSGAFSIIGESSTSKR